MAHRHSVRVAAIAVASVAPIALAACSSGSSSSSSSSPATSGATSSAAAAGKNYNLELIVGTKFGYDFYKNPERPRGQRELPQDMSPEFVRFACEQSLRRLGVEQIAIYQPHNPRVVTLMQDEHWETLERLKSEGKIVSWGPSLGPAIGWRDEGIYSAAVRQAPVTQMIYVDVSPPLLRVAEFSVQAHLEKLIREGRVKNEAGRYRLLDAN